VPPTARVPTRRPGGGVGGTWVVPGGAFAGGFNVGGADAEQMDRGIAPFRKDPYVWPPEDSGLEDVFIHLMGNPNKTDRT